MNRDNVNMKLALILLALFIVPAVTLSQNKNAKKTKEQKIVEELIKLDKELTEASKRKDGAFVSQYISDDYADTSSTGRVSVYIIAA
jgi:hypothetical protein